VNLVGIAGDLLPSGACEEVLRDRSPHAALTPHESLPDDTRLWAALQQAGGGTWGGCVYDVDSIVGRLQR